MIQVMQQTSNPGSRVRSPRSQKLIDVLRAEIRSGALKPGDKLVPIRDLAVHHKVTYRTVQTALAHLEELGLVERIQGSGTYVKQQQREVDHRRLSSQVHLIFAGQPNNVGPLIEPLLLELQAAGLLPVPIFFEDSADGEEARSGLVHVLRQWEQEPPQAVIVKFRQPGLARLVRQHCPPQTRVIKVYSSPDANDRRWDVVVPDEFAMYELAAKYVLSQGHKRAMLLTARRRVAGSGRDQEQQHHVPSQAMSEVFEQAGAAYRLSIQYIERTRVDPDGVGASSDALRTLLNVLKQGDKRPTAFVGTASRLSSLRMAAAQLDVQLNDVAELVCVGDASPAKRGECVCVSEQYDEIARQTVRLVCTPRKDSVAHSIVVPPRFVPRCIFDSGPQVRGRWGSGDDLRTVEVRQRKKLGRLK